MINTERPLVIYDHMRISLDTLDIDSVELKLTDSKVRLYGKRGDVALNYDLCCNDERVGRGPEKDGIEWFARIRPGENRRPGGEPTTRARAVTSVTPHKAEIAASSDCQSAAECLMKAVLSTKISKRTP